MERYLCHDNLLEVKDISTAAFLYTQNNIKFRGIKRLTNGQVFFLFESKEEGEELVRQYWELQASPVQAKLLFNALRDLKDILYRG